MFYAQSTNTVISGRIEARRFRKTVHIILWTCTEFDSNVQATDKDGDCNNEIRYSISPASELASNFTVNSTTGRLGLSGSSGLDFEALPNKSSGVVQLIIVASDSGHPSLSSSVSVLVTVAVRWRLFRWMLIGCTFLLWLDVF